MDWTKRSMRIASWMMLSSALLLAACSSAPERKVATAPVNGKATYKVGKPYQVAGRWYYPQYDPQYEEVGTGSWYGEQFQGRLTANGEVFDKEEVSAAHPTLPLPSIVRVTNLDNGRSLKIRVNDRGPFVGTRVIDLSQAAARELGYEKTGLAHLRVKFLQIAPDAGGTPVAPDLQVAERPKNDVVQVASVDELASAYAGAASPTAEQERRAEAAPFRASTVEVRTALEGEQAPAVCASGGDPLFVQVGAFSDAARAQAAAHAMKGFGQPRLEPVFVRGEALLRLRVGPVTEPLAARMLLQKVKQAGNPQAFLTEADGPAKPAEPCRT